ncbi:carbohydrate kinase family protein [Timonella senegalensis]|uniref:carbohydrate kinase family protein n=1 Tax=Timonella senegalensis TaxID=1465825 RepID=UPI00030551E2|nr:carbohydrate kinase family protein [Timonella senegalensis]
MAARTKNNARVFVSGPSSWNTMVYLDALPEPRPHTIFAEETVETPGGTSLGKALNLAALGATTLLLSPIGPDMRGEQLRSLVRSVGVEDLGATSQVTERHINLMTRSGERLSIYAATPQGVQVPGKDDLQREMRASDAVILDLSDTSSTLAPLAKASGTPIWTDLHDYDGASSFHEPFVESADYVFMNADALGDPKPLMSRLIAAGKRLAVCTLGAEGAVGLTQEGGFVHVNAAPTNVVDTNGAGDAFMAATLMAILGGAPTRDALEAGAQNAALALQSKHLHASLDALL